MGTETWIYLGGLAVLDTLSPTIIGVTLFLILTDSKNITSRLLSYLLTVVILYFSLGIIMLSGLNFITEAFSTFFQSELFKLALLVLGIILLAGSYYIPADKKSDIPKPETQSIFSMVFIGVVTFIIEAGTALPYLAAIGLLTAIDIPFWDKTPIIAAYNMIMVLPALVIFMGYTLFRKRITPALVRLQNKILNRSNSALSWMLFIVGLILILHSIDGITISIK